MKSQLEVGDLRRCCADICWYSVHVTCCERAVNFSFRSRNFQSGLREGDSPRSPMRLHLVPSVRVATVFADNSSACQGVERTTGPFCQPVLSGRSPTRPTARGPRHMSVSSVARFYAGIVFIVSVENSATTVCSWCAGPGRPEDTCVRRYVAARCTHDQSRARPAPPSIVCSPSYTLATGTF